MTTEVALEPAMWQVVNDTVMGGASSSSVRPIDDGGLRFEGRVSLDGGGGFASARRAWALPADVMSQAVSAFALRVRGDGKRYRLTVFTLDPRTGQRENYHYQAAFDTAGGEQRVVLPLAVFVASFRGRRVSASALSPADIVAIGLQVSDRQAGEFKLDVRSISLVTGR